MTVLLLFAAGMGAGVVGVVGGLASIVSYPALLAAGLSPVLANMTNTVAMTAVSAGTIVGSQKELRGNAGRLGRLAGLGVLGGAGGAALLLNTEPATFEVVVPFLVASGAVLLLVRDPLRRWAHRHGGARSVANRQRDLALRTSWWLAVIATSIYAGYFGAGAGIIVLALLLLRYVEPYAVTNAIKTLVTGAANSVAAILYVVVADIDWMIVTPMAVGMFIGGALGPAVVRRLPERLLRYSVGGAGLLLACGLFLT